MNLMMQEAAKNRELVSALTDGQLRGDDFARTVEWLNQTDDARLTWHAYHLVGDVLRSGESVVSARDADFLQGLRQRLQQPQRPQSDQVNAPDLVAAARAETVARVSNGSHFRSANDSHFGWKLLVGLTSVSMAAVIGWQALRLLSDLSGAPQLAQVPTQQHQPEAGSMQQASGTEPPRMIRDPQLDALLAAHKQFGGTSALQGPAGFLRNATFEGVGP